jgi:peptide deformylase
MDKKPELPKILLWPNKMLEQKSTLVEKFDGDLAELVRQMIAICIQTKALGLSAVQIGVPINVFVVMDEAGKFQEHINPTYTALVAPKVAAMNEGCLSYPGQEIIRIRPVEIDAAWQDLTGAHHSARMTGLTAQAFQHELEHLQGLTIIDALTDLGQRAKLRSEAIRIKRAGFTYRYNKS